MTVLMTHLTFAGFRLTYVGKVFVAGSRSQLPQLIETGLDRLILMKIMNILHSCVRKIPDIFGNRSPF
jgi:hypothetical protein